MRHSLENGTLTFYLEGELNSSNSEDAEKEIDQIMQSNEFKSIVLDMKDLRYTSSAGLRIIVRLKQQCDDTSLVKVPKDIYSIFEMVGFQNLLKIERL
ncbi:MAG: STAS domain-containing protein [Candidatus Methanomethylophilaceae archaeon]|nr:STAS domain-containing protein [Candidatus Methanomethylophilaceae archaeon]MBR6911492.1 STAS domain-containing protein [Candidatus Methanomethylophilaceae archaeon]